MLKNFSALIRTIREEILEKDDNKLVVEIGDEYISFRLFDAEEAHIIYYPYDCDCRGNDFRIAIDGLRHEIDDLVEIDAIYATINLIKNNRKIIDEEIFALEEEVDA